VNARQKPRAQSALTTQHHKSKPEPPAPAHPGITRAPVLRVKTPGELATPSPHTAIHFTRSCLPKAQIIPCSKPGVRPGGATLVPAYGTSVWGGLFGGDYSITCSKVCFTIQALLSSPAFISSILVPQKNCPLCANP